MKKKIITITAMALANSFATSPQIQNASKVYDILGRKYDKVTAQRVIKNIPASKAQVTDDYYQYSSFPTSRRAALKVRQPDANTLAVGQDINFSYTSMFGPYATPMPARKDTKLLVLGWGKHIESRGWDVSHMNRRHWDDEEAYRCWVVAAQEMNHAYMRKKLGNDFVEHEPDRMLLTQDEIKYRVFHDSASTPVDDFPLAHRGSASNEIITKALNFALGTIGTNFYGNFGQISDFTEWSRKNNVKTYITRTIALSKAPVVIAEDDHIMVVDAYAFSNSGEMWIRLLNPNNDGSFQWRTFKSVNICGIAVVPQNQVNPPYSDPLIFQDADTDGLMDFDEEYRFHTKYASIKDRDSDRDGVWDKDEIRAYTLRALPEYTVPKEGMSSDPSERPLNTWNNVFITNAEKNYWADANHNGINAEKDPNEQGSNNYNPRPVYATDDAPEGIDIYARETINIGSNAYIRNTTIAAEKVSSGTTVTVSAKSSSGSITVYTQGGVVFNGGAKIHILEKFSDNNNINVSLSNGSRIEWFQDNNPRKNWAWQVKTDLPSISCGVNETLVKSGKTFTLKNGSKYSSLRVMDGATLVLEPGEVYIKSLTLYAGSKVQYGNGKTTIHISGGVTWNAKNSTNTDQTRRYYANNFKLIHHGTAALNISSGWYGHIYAPNADLNLGSNGGDIFGKLVGKNINIASGTYYYSASY